MSLPYVRLTSVPVFPYPAHRKPVMDDVYWPTYSREKQEYFIFNAETSGVGKGPRAKACAFWNDFLPRLRNTSGEFPD